MDTTTALTGTADAMFSSRLKLKHLTLFQNVCQLRTLRKAADASHMTQPAATKLIHELEELFAVPLFRRTRSGMTLTLHGHVVRRHVDILLADIGNMRAEVEMLSDGVMGLIRLGVVPSLAPALLAQSIAQTLKARPHVRFEVLEGSTTALLASLNRNELDLIFGRVLNAAQAESLRVVNVYAESFAIVCAAGHPLARRRSIRWGALARQTWVLPPAGTPMRQLVDNMFTRHHALRPEAAVESNNFIRMQHLIHHSELLGIVPRSMALEGVANHELAVLSPGVADDFAPISLISRSDIDQPPLMDLFSRVVLETAAAMKLGVDARG